MYRLYSTASHFLDQPRIQLTCDRFSTLPDTAAALYLMQVGTAAA
jgi:hypothetical protein